MRVCGFQTRRYVITLKPSLRMCGLLRLVLPFYIPIPSLVHMRTVETHFMYCIFVPTLNLVCLFLYLFQTFNLQNLMFIFTFLVLYNLLLYHLQVFQSIISRRSKQIRWNWKMGWIAMLFYRYYTSYSW